MPRFIYWIGIALGACTAAAGIYIESELLALAGAAVVLLAWGELYGYGNGED